MWYRPEMRDLTSIQLCCFDNDGTLFASHEVANPAIQRCYVRFCAGHGLRVEAPSDEAICRLTGQPGHTFYREILPEPLRDHSAGFREECLKEEVVEIGARGRLFPGIEEMLIDLRASGRRIALVTNAGPVYMEAVRRKVGYDRLLDGIYHFGRDGLNSKAAMIRAALGELGCGTALMVGDRSSDLEGAAGAGVPFVGCLYGYGEPAELDGADFLVRDVGMLRRLLTGAP